MVESLYLHLFSKVVIGGVNYLVAKLFLDMSYDSNNDMEQKKSVLLTWSNFVSLVLLGLPLFWNELRQLRSLGEKNPYTFKANLALWFPGFLECVAVYLSMKGNEKLPASTLVFMKATRVFWSALLTLFYLRKPVYKFMWLGVVLAIIGLMPILAVSGSKKDAKKEIKKAFLEADRRAGKITDTYYNKKMSKLTAKQESLTLPTIMVAGCELARALRVILEEKQLKVEGRSPEFVQWVEGYVGLVVSTLLFVMAHNVSETSSFHEDMNHTADMLMVKDPRLKWGTTAVILFVWHTLLVGLVNYSSTVVTKRLSSVHNAIFSELRIFIVWGVEFLLAVAYHNKHGVAFKPLYLVEVVGFAIIVLSAFVYSGKYKIPFTDFLYPADHPLVQPGQVAEAKTARTASPSTSSEKVNQAF